MKILSIVLFVLISFLGFSQDENYVNLFSEREKLVLDYQKIIDSTILNRNTRLLLLNENLTNINRLDETIIANQSVELKQLADSIKVLNTRIGGLSFDKERLEQRTINDLRMILILKVSAAVLIVIVLILIFSLVTKTGKRTLLARLNEKLTLLEKEKDELNEEVLKLRAVNSALVRSDRHHEREQFESEISRLQSQLDEAKTKNKTILMKIEKLISDLSGVTS